MTTTANGTIVLDGTGSDTNLSRAAGTITLSGTPAGYAFLAHGGGYGLKAAGGALLRATLPRPRVVIWATVGTYSAWGANLTYGGGYRLTGIGGAVARVTLPKVSVSLSGTSAVVAGVKATIAGGYTLAAYGGGVGGGTLPKPILAASGTSSVSGRANLRHRGKYALAGYAGGIAKARLPKPTLTVAATVRVLGRLNATLPAAKVTITGTTYVTGRVSATVRNKYTLVGLGGGVANARLPKPTFVGHGFTGAAGRLNAKLPKPVFSGSGTVSLVGRLNAVLPALRKVSGGVLVATLPRATLVATGTIDVIVEYEAYSVALLPNPDGGMAPATTHYTTFPFDRIVRFQNKYYGVASDGLYELDGDSFNGEPIVATVQTAQTDFGVAEFKRFPSLYLHGRVGADLDVSIITAEKDTNSYPTYRPVVKDDASVHRVLFGKGIRAHYAAYKFTNVNGENFTIDAMAPRVDRLTRQI